MPRDYRFSFGPWNISEGADPFGPAVRPTIDFARKLPLYRELGFEGVQLHDDDAVPGIEDLSPSEVCTRAAELRRVLDGEGLVAEFVAPRLWESPMGVDGGYTANDPACRRWAIERSKRAADVADAMGVELMVLWLAREGTYIRESKSPLTAQQHLLDAVNELLAYHPGLRWAIEPKPNEPVDLALLPTMGHAMAFAQRTADPPRVGGLVESAHALLVGLDPAEEMAFAMACGKLWSVHLNDQNGLKFDQDKSFGSVNLRSAFHQVRVLEEAAYADSGRFVGLDVKAMRTQPTDRALKHLSTSKEVFLQLVEKARTFPQAACDAAITARDYEEVERLVLTHLLGA
ncbi:MAG: TIM barrel protein [Lacipirellulaceae bacterium]